MWTSITWCLSPNSGQALTPLLVISRLIKQKKQLVYMEELHTSCDFRRATSSSGLYGEVLLLRESLDSSWGSVDPGDIQCLPALLCWALCLLSKFFQVQELRNCNLCLLMRTSSACKKSTSSWVRNFPLYRVISPAQSFLPALSYLIWSCPGKLGLKACTVLGDGPPQALQHISTSAAIGKGLRLVLQVCNNVLLSTGCKFQQSQGETC